MKYNDEDICICGCEFQDHDCHEDGWCMGCFVPPDFIDCPIFKLDNLKYLEQQYEQRTK